MPSWNIHTAHVERLLSQRTPDELGIEDVNAFLFGNYVPDIHLGFMVPDTTYRIDYCVTHLARPSMIPLPDADRFWDDCVARRRPKDAIGASLALGAWAHLFADRAYNAAFRKFCATHDVPEGEELRLRKQADFDRFGHALPITSRVEVASELLEAARRFRPYEIHEADVVKAVAVANGIVDQAAAPQDGEAYQLLDRDWMSGTFDACDGHMTRWLEAWRCLEAQGGAVMAADVRAEAGLDDGCAAGEAAS